MLMIGNYLLITLSLKRETTCSSGIGRPFPRVIRTVVITTLSRNGSVCLIYKTVEFILMNIYMNSVGKIYCLVPASPQMFTQKFSSL